ncbi:MAG: hypothetical protein COB23_05625 [Methylophaga sp.]|nr:MAG: hypothetical protein COB23_05625 [Methylophaga sp.]
MALWPKSGFKLRSKLLLLSLVFVLLPWLGVSYIQAIEDLLQQEQEKSISTIAQAAAMLVEQQPDIFTQRMNLLATNSSTKKIAVTSITTPIFIDGYDEEWRPYASLLQYFPIEDQHNRVRLIDPQDVSARYILAQQNDTLAILLDVVDDKVIFRDPSQHQRHGGDAIIVALKDQQQRVHRYILSASAPGNINVYEYIGSYLDPVVIKRQSLIKAAWQISSYGYRIELTIPDSMLTDVMALAVIDIDNDNTAVQVIGLGDVRDSDLFSYLLLPSFKLTSVLSTMAKDGVRIWLVDNQTNNIAAAGLGDVVIAAPKLNSLADLFYGLFLTQALSDDESLSHEQAVLSGRAVQAALEGKAQAERRKTSSEGHTIIVAAQPVFVDGKIVGAIVVEKNTNSILALQNKAVKTLLNTTLFVVAIVMIVLLGFAGRLSFRIGRLNRDVADAVNYDGRVTGQFSHRVESDELGELRQSFGLLFERLGHYNHYLEALASRLAHELRTPIAVIKTSLEHIQQHTNDAGLRYIERARLGSDRLNAVVARMSEASQLEQTVNNADFEVFDFNKLLVDVIPMYQDIYADVELEYHSSDIIVMLDGAQDLLVQMLDKLVSNAVDFHQVNTPILISLEQRQHTCCLIVKNTGEMLPIEIEMQLFQPMVSMRKVAVKSAIPHLGLGLYIVKLIVEIHHGNVVAQNWQNGVEFLVELPIKRA